MRFFSDRSRVQETRTQELFALNNPSKPASGRTVLAAAANRISSLAATLGLPLLLMFGMATQAYAVGNPTNGSTIFNNNTTYCTQCHISPPETNRLLAANNAAYLQNRINQNWPIGDSGTNW